MTSAVASAPDLLRPDAPLAIAHLPAGAVGEGEGVPDLSSIRKAAA
jgi:hypothetical protein